MIQFMEKGQVFIGKSPIGKRVLLVKDVERKTHTTTVVFEDPINDEIFFAVNIKNRCCPIILFSDHPDDFATITEYDRII